MPEVLGSLVKAFGNCFTPVLNGPVSRARATSPKPQILSPKSQIRSHSQHEASSPDSRTLNFIRTARALNPESQKQRCGKQKFLHQHWNFSGNPGGHAMPRFRGYGSVTYARAPKNRVPSYDRECFEVLNVFCSIAIQGYKAIAEVL